MTRVLDCLNANYQIIQIQQPVHPDDIMLLGKTLREEGWDELCDCDECERKRALWNPKGPPADVELDFDAMMSTLEWNGHGGEGAEVI